MRSMCRVLIKKTRLQCTTKTVNLHVRLTQIVLEQDTSSMSLVQRQRRCDGRTYRAETVEQRVDGGWRNEDAVVQQLERPVYTAQTDNPVPGYANTCTPSPQACMLLNAAQSEAGVSSRGRTSCRSRLALQRIEINSSTKGCLIMFYYVPVRKYGGFTQWRCPSVCLFVCSF